MPTGATVYRPLASFLGLHLAVLALVVSPLVLLQARPAIFRAVAAHAGQGQTPVSQVPAAICPVQLALGLAAPVLAAPPAALPPPRLVALHAAPPHPARNTPPVHVTAARPRGPPVQV